jgi:CheY-like chemotaxis protein
MKLGTILHAEDDENDAFLFRLALSQAGVPNPLVQVPNGQEAVHYLAGTGLFCDREKYSFPSLLITDLKMPEFSGFDLLEYVRNLPEAKQLRVIVLTSSVADSDRAKCFELGADGYFVKPSGLAGLLALVDELKESWIPASGQPA